MRKNLTSSKIVCIKLVHLPYLYIYIYRTSNEKSTSLCIRYTGALGGCRLQGCCQIYDRVCRAEGFGLLLAAVREHIATLPNLNKNIH